MNQNKKRKQTHESAHFGLEITFKVIYNDLYFAIHREEDRLKNKTSKIEKKSKNLKLKII